jgi:hypothetical protein
MNQVAYAWALECVSDDEDEEVGQLDHFNRLRALLRHQRLIGDAEDGWRWIIELVKLVGNDHEIDGTYARVRDGQVCERFDNGEPVPKRFMQECRKAFQSCRSG